MALSSCLSSAGGQRIGSGAVCHRVLSFLSMPQDLSGIGSHAFRTACQNDRAPTTRDSSTRTRSSMQPF